jgi:two-component system response regulator AtoC
LSSRFEFDSGGALVIVTSRRGRTDFDGMPRHGELVCAIKGLDLGMPPLRERRMDIPRLVRVLVEEISDQLGRSSMPPTGDALDALIHYGWPGNVHELEHALERAVISAKEGERIELADLPRTMRGAGLEPDGAGIRTLAEIEKQHILATLQACGNNRQATADALGIGLNTLWRRLMSYGHVRRRTPR